MPIQSENSVRNPAPDLAFFMRAQDWIAGVQAKIICGAWSCCWCWRVEALTGAAHYAKRLMRKSIRKEHGACGTG
jgi:hypothetical protein